MNIFNFFSSTKEEEVNKNDERKIHFSFDRLNLDTKSTLYFHLENDTTCESILKNENFIKAAIKIFGNDYEKKCHLCIIDIKNNNSELKLSNKIKLKKLLGISNDLQLFFINNKQVKNNIDNNEIKKTINIYYDNYIKNIPLLNWDFKENKYIKCNISLSYDIFSINDKKYLFNDYKNKIDEKIISSIKEIKKFKIEEPLKFQINLFDYNKKENCVKIFKIPDKGSRKQYDSLIKWLEEISASKYLSQLNITKFSDSINKNIETFEILIEQIFKNNLDLNFFLSKIKWAKILLTKKFISNLNVPDIISVILDYKDSFQKKEMMNIWNVFKLLHRNINNLKEDNEISRFVKSKSNEIVNLNNQVIQKYAKLQSNPNVQKLNNIMLSEIFKIDFFDFLLNPILEKEDFSELNAKIIEIGNKKNGIYSNEITIYLNKILASIYLNIYHFKLKDFLELKVE